MWAAACSCAAVGDRPGTPVPATCLVPGTPSPTFQGVLESFLGTAFAGSIFCLFSGQPLTILSSTGPVLVFERLLFSFSQ